MFTLNFIHHANKLENLRITCEKHANGELSANVKLAETNFRSRNCKDPIPVNRILKYIDCIPGVRKYIKSQYNTDILVMYKTLETVNNHDQNTNICLEALIGTCDIDKCNHCTDMLTRFFILGDKELETWYKYQTMRAASPLILRENPIDLGIFNIDAVRYPAQALHTREVLQKLKNNNDYCTGLVLDDEKGIPACVLREMRLAYEIAVMMRSKQSIEELNILEQYREIFGEPHVHLGIYNQERCFEEKLNLPAISLRDLVIKLGQLGRKHVTDAMARRYNGPTHEKIISAMFRADIEYYNNIRQNRIGEFILETNLPHPCLNIDNYAERLEDSEGLHEVINGFAELRRQAQVFNERENGKISRSLGREEMYMQKEEASEESESESESESEKSPVKKVSPKKVVKSPVESSSSSAQSVSEPAKKVVKSPVESSSSSAQSVSEPAKKVVKKAEIEKKVPVKKVTKKDESESSETSSSETTSVKTISEKSISSQSESEPPAKKVTKLPAKKVVKKAEIEKKVPVKKVTKKDESESSEKSISSQSESEPPAKKVTKLPAKKVSEPPAKKVIESPAKNVTKPPVKNVTKPPVKKAIESPVKNVTKPPVKKVIESPVKNVTKPPVKKAIESPVKNVTKPPVKKVIESPVKNVTKPPVKKAIESPVNKVTVKKPNDDKIIVKNPSTTESVVPISSKRTTSNKKSNSECATDVYCSLPSRLGNESSGEPARIVIEPPRIVVKNKTTPESYRSTPVASKVPITSTNMTCPLNMPNREEPYTNKRTEPSRPRVLPDRNRIISERASSSAHEAIQSNNQHIYANDPDYSDNSLYNKSPLTSVQETKDHMLNQINRQPFNNRTNYQNEFDNQRNDYQHNNNNFKNNVNYQRNNNYRGNNYRGNNYRGNRGNRYYNNRRNNYNNQNNYPREDWQNENQNQRQGYIPSYPTYGSVSVY